MLPRKFFFSEDKGVNAPEKNPGESMKPRVLLKLKSRHAGPGDGTSLSALACAHAPVPVWACVRVPVCVTARVLSLCALALRVKCRQNGGEWTGCFHAVCVFVCVHVK